MEPASHMLLRQIAKNIVAMEKSIRASQVGLTYLVRQSDDISKTDARAIMFDVGINPAIIEALLIVARCKAGEWGYWACTENTLPECLAMITADGKPKQPDLPLQG